MQVKRPSPPSPLAIVLPHPPLPRRASSNLSTCSSPHTPITRTPPIASSFFLPQPNRKSTDSWNSSNHDEPDCKWKPEHTLLLLRTLDALPSHLLTPFNGAVPPSNLLDKIACGVLNAKGPVDWPHSIRATRMKLMELSRIRAKEAAQDGNCKITIKEGDDACASGQVLPQQTTSTVSKRPLYRQSSMDFMNSATLDIKDNDNITRLSNRLQRTDRLISNPAYHPYSRPSLHRSPRSESRQDPFSLLLNKHTPSCSSINSSSSSRSRRVRRSLSTLSSSSDQLMPSLSELAEISRIHRVRRAEALGVSPPNTGSKIRPSLKRLPTFSAAARAVPDNDVSSTSSSDEEEKIRMQQAKKLRTKNHPPSPAATQPSLTPARTKIKVKAPELNSVSTASKSSLKSSSGSSTSKTSSTDTAKSSSTAATTISSGSLHSAKPKPRMNLQRNPSMFGGELPHPQTPAVLSRGNQRAPLAPRSPIQPPAPSNTTPVTPTTIAVSPPRTLRRMRAVSFARAPARRISFSSMIPHTEDCGIGASAAGNGLGSAFQLR